MAGGQDVFAMRCPRALNQYSAHESGLLGLLGMDALMPRVGESRVRREQQAVH